MFHPFLSDAWRTAWKRSTGTISGFVQIPLFPQLSDDITSKQIIKYRENTSRDDLGTTNQAKTLPSNGLPHLIRSTAERVCHLSWGTAQDLIFSDKRGEEKGPVIPQHSTPPVRVCSSVGHITASDQIRDGRWNIEQRQLSNRRRPLKIQEISICGTTYSSLRCL